MTIDGAPPRRERTAPLGRTLAVARPAAGRLALTALLGAGAIAADIGLIGTAAWLISKAAQHPDESQLAVAIVGVQFFGLSRGFFRYQERLVGHDAAFRLLADLRVRFYEQLERLTPSGLPAFRRGDLLARIVQDIDSLQDLVIRVIPPFGSAVLMGSLTVALLWWMLPAAAVILAVTLLLAGILVPWLTGQLARRRESRFAAARGDLGVSVVDLTEGAPELVAFGAMDAQLATIRQHDAELTAIAAASAGTTGVGSSLTTLLAGLACWGCLLVGIPAVTTGRLSGTDLAVVTLIPLAAFEVVIGLPAATQALQRVRQAAARLFEVTDAPVPVVDPEVSAALPGAPYDVEARSVWAGYPNGSSPVLRGVDLPLASGRRVAVVGPSGAGKSTLATVLLRFLPVAAGAVRLNGVPFGRLAGDDLRTVVGMVGQDAYLFDATIADNLCIGGGRSSDEELRDVLVRVGLAGWLDGLPKGLGTEVGRHGSRLSGGQRQRVAVARALLADFPVVVLDEPSEHLDPVAADALTADLLEVTDDRSLVLITHRLAGLESMDQILVMDEGRVVEQGTHDVLIDQDGRYAALWWEEMRTERYATVDETRPAAASVHQPPPHPTATTAHRGRHARRDAQ
jgi:thiol reductant ABC exporter CydC subunit